MSRFGRIHRQPDHFSSTHERAQARAAERIDGPLGLAESAWLEEHLAGCPACAAIAASYEADREALRTLRDAPPEPPRDLWARTAAAIEQESAARGRSGARAAAPTSRRRLPLGAMSGLAVIAVVVGVSAVSSGLLGGGAATASLATDAAEFVAPEAATTDGDTASGGAAVGAIPTPIAVGAGNVKWIRVDGDGQLALNDAAVNEVCPIDGAADCGTLDDHGAERVSIASRPRTIIASPIDGKAVVVSVDGEGNDQITVMSLSASGVDAAATASPAPDATRQATASPAVPSTAPSSSQPEATASDEPPPASDVPAPSPSPEPTVAAELAIASGVEVVGESAAFSPDGRWFAFTARPSDGSGGTDVYLWKVGDDAARRLTDDGSTTFASWSGDTLIASRPVATDTAAGSTDPLQPTTVTIDPRSGDETTVATAWRPTVDPTGRRAVTWSGTIEPDGSGWRPGEGRLELRSWPDDGADEASQVVADGPIADFDVRWDETGTWFAVWVADAADPDIGRLSLFEVDASTGLIDQPKGAPDGVPALAGFSIGDGRLAWATPPGQGGEGSRVQIVAWTDDAVGSIETAPGAEIVIIR